MLVISDASPLRYLILVGRVELLRELYSRIIIPSAVHRELNHGSAPEAVRRWSGTLPTWVEVRTPEHITPQSATLDAGEREALSLAIELQADLVLLDEFEGRKTAAVMKLRFIGTVGIIVAAAQRNVLGKSEASDVLKALHQTNMRIAQQLIEDALAVIQAL